ncbi:MAG TPA: MYXO-CTERM sorting domain-containing protein [Phycisphaerales bacterium]|nr:MYXO-CTERM sorting domain-containing protein [Phycisphaerales bacterium]
MNLYHQLGAVAVCCTLAGTVLGGNDTPPPWAGTGLVGNSTHWRWDFQGGPVPPFAGTGFGPPNTPPPIVTGGVWAPNAGTDGGWLLPAGGTLTIDVFNFPDPNEFKLIWIQYHLLGTPGALTPPPQIQVNFLGTFAQPWGTPTITTTPDGGLIGAQGFRFPFNPPLEVFTLTNAGSTPIIFEWITIDTICTPTPGAGAALLLGGAALLRRRR